MPQPAPKRSARSLVRLAFALAAVAAAVAAPGCAPGDASEPLGTLDVGWSLGPDTCTDAGVERITIDLDGAIVRDAPCDDGSATIEDVQPGSRQLVLRGLDLDGVERYAAKPTSVTIAADAVTEAPDVLLSALPARVDVTWYFTNGRLCSTNAVDAVELSVWRDGFLEGATEASCDDGSAGIAGLSSGQFVLELRALDDLGELVTRSEIDVELDKGDRQQLEVALEVDAG